MQKTYSIRLREEIVRACKKSRSQSRGWNNRKIKIRDRHLPRGKFYRKFEFENFRRDFQQIVSEIDDMELRLSSKQA